MEKLQAYGAIGASDVDELKISRDIQHSNSKLKRMLRRNAPETSAGQSDVTVQRINLVLVPVDGWLANKYSEIENWPEEDKVVFLTFGVAGSPDGAGQVNAKMPPDQAQLKGRKKVDFPNFPSDAENLFKALDIIFCIINLSPKPT